MENVAQANKVSENLVQTEADPSASKTGFYAVFLSQIRFLCLIDTSRIFLSAHKTIA